MEAALVRGMAGQGMTAVGMTGAGMGLTQAGEGLEAEVLRGLEPAEALWRALEADPACLATPYQRFDWAAAYARTRAGADVRVAVVRDALGRPRMLIPLHVEHQFGLRVARALGGDHANYHLPLFASREAASVSAGALRAALIRAGRAAGLDLIHLAHQPRTWDGMVNPLALGGESCTSHGYGLMLGPDPASTLNRVFSAEARRKLRSKEKRLVEAYGPVACRRAADPEEAAAYLAAFHVQKAARFRAMGIPDPYADAGVRAFLATASAGPTPAMELHALVLPASGRVLAVFGGAVDAGRYSGMITAFDADPEVARFSPGDLLLHHLVRDQAERGRTSFDLGVGEARYKASICDETITLVQAVLPVSAAGHAWALGATAWLRTKRRIKRDPRLARALARLRRSCLVALA